jgi:hypothetical protein
MLIVDHPDAEFNQPMTAGAVEGSPMQERDYGLFDLTVLAIIAKHRHRLELAVIIGITKNVFLVLIDVLFRVALSYTVDFAKPSLQCWR